jgi:hypothetical protein
MRCKDKKGSAIVEYVIPAAVIGMAVGICMYMIFYGGELKSFIAASGNMSLSESGEKASIGPETQDLSIPVNVSGGSLGGTPDKPVKQCDENGCVIDFGTFTLQNLPENFNEFVQTSGGSGASDLISDLLMQLASHLESENQPAEANLLKQMATTGHNMAAIEREFETLINSCNGNQECIFALFDQPFPKPADFNETYYAFPAGMTYKDALYSVAMGEYQFIKSYNYDLYRECIDNNLLSAVFIDQLDQVKASNNIPDDIKGIVQELTWNIGMIGEEFQNNVSIIAVHNNNEIHDPMTGTVGKYLAPDDADPYQFFLDYQASSITDFDSALICAAGYNEDTGKSCH